MNRISTWKRRAQTAALCTVLAAAPLAAHSQGMMNILNSLGGGLGSAITGGRSAPAAQGDDLISLLTQSMENIDEPKEIEIGRQLAALLLGAKPAHPDMALQRYVNRLGRWISLQSPRAGLPWTFVVLDDAGYNAFAAPGGYVFVTKGLIDRCADESELAGILAHEITHVTAKHHL
ncbi:MAG TPA: M48 family metalloprotease, partial [Acidovorax sp.]|nr:M48 family metalloprotease [Acidovorax sp.]